MVIPLFTPPGIKLWRMHNREIHFGCVMATEIRTSVVGRVVQLMTWINHCGQLVCFTHVGGMTNILLKCSCPIAFVFYYREPNASRPSQQLWPIQILWLLRRIPHCLAASWPSKLWLLAARAWQFEHLCCVITGITIVVTTQSTQPATIQAQYCHGNKVSIILQPNVTFYHMDPNQSIWMLPHPAVWERQLSEQQDSNSVDATSGTSDGGDARGHWNVCSFESDAASAQEGFIALEQTFIPSCTMTKIGGPRCVAFWPFWSF